MRGAVVFRDLGVSWWRNHTGAVGSGDGHVPVDRYCLVNASMPAPRENTSCRCRHSSSFFRPRAPRPVKALPSVTPMSADGRRTRVGAGRKSRPERLPRPSPAAKKSACADHSPRSRGAAEEKTSAPRKPAAFRFPAAIASRPPRGRRLKTAADDGGRKRRRAGSAAGKATARAHEGYCNGPRESPSIPADLRRGRHSENEIIVPRSRPRSPPSPGHRRDEAEVVEGRGRGSSSPRSRRESPAPANR